MDRGLLAQLEQNYQADKVAQASQPQFKKQKGKGGWLTSLISEAGGTGGALGGAALGASLGSVVPGIGTLIGGLAGAGIGGFLGGTGGRLAENKIRDDEYRLNEALKEGALTGALSAIPLGGAGKAVRGVAGATKAAAKTAAKEAAEVAERKAAQEVAEQIAKSESKKITGKSVGRLAAGSEAKAGKNAALREILDAEQFNRLAKEHIDLLGKEPTSIKLVPKNRVGGATDITVRRGGIEPESTVFSRRGPKPSFASEGIEPKPIPDIPFAPDRLAIPGSKPTATDFYGVPLPEATGAGTGPTAFETPENVLSRFGGKLRAIPRGIEPGVDIGGGRNLSTAAAKAQNRALDQVTKGGKGIGLSGQFTQAEKEVSKLVKAYKASPEAATRISDDMVDDLLGRVEANIQANPSLRAALRPGSKSSITRATYDEIINDLQALRGKTAADVADYAPRINKMAKAIVERGNTGTKEVQVVDEIRDALTSFIDDALPDKSGTNKQISNLMGAMRGVGKAKTRDVGASAGQGLTVGRMLSNVANPAMDVTGRGFQTLGTAIGPSTKGAAVPKDILTRGVAGREALKQGLLGSLVGGVPQEDADVQGAQTGLTKEDMEAIRQSDMGVLGEESEQDTGNPFGAASIQNAIVQDMANNGGKNVSTLVTLYKTFGQAEEQTADQKNKAAKAQALKGSIDLLAGNFKKAGGGQGAGGLLASFLGRTPGIRSAGLAPEAQVFEDKRKSLIAPLARAISGEVGVLTDRDISRAEGLLPRLSDPPEVAQQKISELYQLLGQAGSAGAPRDFAEEDYAAASLLGGER